MLSWPQDYSPTFLLVAQCLLNNIIPKRVPFCFVSFFNLGEEHVGSQTRLLQFSSLPPHRWVQTSTARGLWLVNMAEHKASLSSRVEERAVIVVTCVENRKDMEPKGWSVSWQALNMEVQNTNVWLATPYSLVELLGIMQKTITWGCSYTTTILNRVHCHRFQL
jgi:hypothetical protein